MFTEIERLSAFTYVAMDRTSMKKVFIKLTRTHNQEVHASLAGIALLWAFRWNYSTIVVYLAVAQGISKTKLSPKAVEKNFAS